MSDYYPLMSRAVSQLESNTLEARRALFERARAILVEQLRSRQPTATEPEIMSERFALDDAVRKIEREFAGVIWKDASALAILIGAALVGAAIIGARLIAPYEIAAAMGADGNPFVWRVNVWNGDVQSCAFVRVTPVQNTMFDKFDPDKAPFTIQCRSRLDQQ